VTIAGISTTKIGRPRSTETHTAVCQAVVRLVEGGATLSSLSFVSIAQATGVSRNSLYRRWKSKEQLYSDVVRSIRHQLPELSEQSARDNLIVLMGVMHDRDPARPEQQMERAIVSEAKAFPDLLELYETEIVAPLEFAIKRAIRRGKETGEIRSDVDEGLFCDALVTYAFAWSSSDRSTSRRIVELVFDGVAPT